MTSPYESWPEAEPGGLLGTTIWRIGLALDDSSLSACRATLDEKERNRADRYLRREDRDRFIASHAALRLILARALAIDPRSVHFDHGPSGKPGLAGTIGSELRFNLSHSGAWALIGVSQHAIGVDVEHIRPVDGLDLARRFFARREAIDLEKTPERDRLPAFYACWTRKEAFVKAVGLSFGLDRFAVTVTPDPAALISCDRDDVARSGWTLLHLEPEEGYAGAAAIAGLDRSCTQRSLPHGWAERLC